MKVAQKNKESAPFTLLVFGASGSLAKLKIFPSIYELFHKKRLPENFQVVGYARSGISQKAFREQFADSVREHVDYAVEKRLESLLEHVHYFQGQYDGKGDYRGLCTFVRELEKHPPKVRMAYFSVPPSAFDAIVTNLGTSDLNKGKPSLRLIVEKPFGYDGKSAMELEALLHRHFKSPQIFMLDHYLGKEAVTNILSLRYANTILAVLLDNNWVSNVQINALEEKDIEGRGSYFDNSGILRDMIQSHVLQILSVATMSLPEEESTEEIHRQKIRLLESIRMSDLSSSVVRGQYLGYTTEKGVDPKSQTETFAALKVSLDHPLWQGIPFYLRTGKAVANRWTSVVVEFKPHCEKCRQKGLPPNRLIFEIQPDQQIRFNLLTKLGGETFDFHNLSTGQSVYCTGDCLSEHGRLFLDVVDGKKDLFLDFREILAGWKVVDPIQEACNSMRQKCCDLHTYAKGSPGPAAADDLIARDGFAWYNPAE